MTTERIGNAVFSVDVEDWFHILDVPGTPPLDHWAALPSRVEANFHRMLDILSEHNARCTCFFLGWIGERFPHLVREAVLRGHEIASHGYSHRLVYTMTEQEFRDDATRSRMLLEDIAGKRVLGFRAPGFSVAHKIPWFFEVIKSAGYIYDSSVFPTGHGHGGMAGAAKVPNLVSEQPPLLEFPLTVTSVLGREMCFFGGGYLRLYPYWIVRSMAKKVEREKRVVIFYVHPREIDPNHPRLQMNWLRKFKSYVNLEGTEAKIRKILGDFKLMTMDEYVVRISSELGIGTANEPGRERKVSA